MGAAKGPTLTKLTHSRQTAPAGRAELAVAIDGGNSKTEVVVLEGGRERARSIGGGSGAGPGAVVRAVSAVLQEQGVDPVDAVRVSAAVAGLDFPGDEVGHLSALQELFPNASVEVVGDAVAVLEAGAGSGHALAVVCGAGMNAVAQGPLGRATVPALGWPSGDRGGGDDLGREAVRAAARAEDGRGPVTALLQRVLAKTGMPDAVSLARAIRDGAVSERQVGALAATVAAAAGDGDAVARALIEDAAREALLLAGVVIRGAWPDGAAPRGIPAVLAGGLFSDPGFRSAVSDGLRERGFDPRPLEFRPVDGLVRVLRERGRPGDPASPADPADPADPARSGYPAPSTDPA